MEPLKEEEEKEVTKYEYENLEEEIEYVLDHIPRSEAFDDNSLRVTIFHTMLKNWELVFKFTSDYPNTPLNWQIKTRTLPPKLVEIIKKGAEKKTSELWEEGKYQVLKIYEYYNDVLEHNNLIPAWKEIQQVRKLLDPKKDSVKLFPKAGKVKYILSQDNLR